MLQCDFQFQYDGFHLNVDFSLEQQIMGVMGASGRGKSTLLKNIVGLLAPKQGRIVFNDNIFVDTDKHICLAMHQRKTALIFQKALLFPHLNVQQNLLYGQPNSKEQHLKFQFNDIIDMLDIKSLLKRKAHKLSGGEAQRVSIGRALLSNPNLLLLDEPLTGLNQQLKQQILSYLQHIHLHYHLPMIYVTHHPEELITLTDNILYL
ncbi:molybdenum ABC transporter ATP-binding protein [Acinetobacter sp. ANC 5054]|uniref:ATP-binding cassette domain-containing protein n=1 Tax=Acinetobacter sp. ANC 5054 TaxID=1977877 RepID=UPI000A35792A|nr:ATP-binding cassette domain-containing protein [Acinetobacter sp. ANC 5054]OTG82703.1 molybdenum ABC transporter ATP-binding protein [Acinetobacter sp. ANC 5054]